MKSLLPYLLSLLLLLDTNLIPAQQLAFNKVVPPFGGFRGYIGGIAQDNNGFIWIATSSGLYKYDGYRFKLYTRNYSNLSSLSSSHLETVYADRKGVIWIGTFSDGLNRFDPATGVFTHFKHDPDHPGSLSNDNVRTILEDRTGRLWVGTWGALTDLIQRQMSFTITDMTEMT